MISNVPTAEDFADHGITFLQFAWDAVFELLLEFSDLKEWGYEINPDATQDYWRAAKKPLSISSALAQQGAELILKAKIAKESPYLLISGPPKDWPKLRDRNPVSFADFRTLDAQDLVRTCDTVCNSPLPEQFVRSYEKFRNRRNALFHTVDIRLDFSQKEILEYILHTANLIAPKRWPSLRKRYLEEQPLSRIIGGDTVTNTLCREMQHVIDLMGRSELKFLFDFDKRRRRYICPRCYWECDHHYPPYPPEYPRTALLLPNTPQSRTLHCFVCGNEIIVRRKPCSQNDCKGNVINVEDDYECLTCFEPQEEDEE